MSIHKKKKRFRIHPLWWPIVLIFSPLLVPFIIKKAIEYRKGKNKIESINGERITSAQKMELPELEFVNISVIVDRATKDGYISDTGVSYLIETDRGKMLFDVGFGPMTEAFTNNTKQLNITSQDFDEVVISHLHTDHMGGNKAQKNRKVTVPEDFLNGEVKKCYIPDEGSSDQFETQRVKKPTLLKNGLISTGPLARMLFFFGHTEEQALIGKIKGKGIFIITGCGHPTIEKIVEITKKLTDEKIFAIIGGLHFPISKSPMEMAGIQFQQIIGTGKPIWKRQTDEDLTSTIEFLKQLPLEDLYLSGHDTCDYSLERMKNEVNAKNTEILTAGVTYSL